MNLEQIDRVILVAETGNITEAAQQLYISQPSLSQTISTLEAEIGAKIFDRRSYPLKLTPEGEIFVRAAKRMLTTNDFMLEQIRKVREGIEGVISIGASIPRCRSMMPLIVPRMRERYPNVMLKFVDGVSQDFEQMILFGSVDLALGNVPPNGDKIGCHRLNSEYYHLVANRSSAFARRLDAIRDARGNLAMPFSLREAADEPFILLHPKRNSRIAFNSMCYECNLVPRIAIEAYDSNLALEFVESDLGVALFPNIVSTQQPFAYRKGAFSFFEIDSKYARRDLYLLYDVDRMINPAMQYIVALILEYFSLNSTRSIPDGLT